MRAKCQYPDWAEKFRTNGHTIRKVRDGYGLYRCTSVYVPGEAYPKSKQEYLGMITEKDGFIPKKSTSDHPSYIEYGLSHFIWSNFKRTLLRSSFSGDELVVRLGIIRYVFGDLSPVMIRSTFLSDGMEDELIEAAGRVSAARITTIENKIGKILDEKMDRADRTVMEALLRLCVMDRKNRTSQIPALPPEAADIMERYKFKHGENKP